MRTQYRNSNFMPARSRWRLAGSGAAAMFTILIIPQLRIAINEIDSLNPWWVLIWLGILPTVIIAILTYCFGPQVRRLLKQIARFLDIRSMNPTIRNDEIENIGVVIAVLGRRRKGDILWSKEDDIELLTQPEKPSESPWQSKTGDSLVYWPAALGSLNLLHDERKKKGKDKPLDHIIFIWTNDSCPQGLLIHVKLLLEKFGITSSETIVELMRRRSSSAVNPVELESLYDQAVKSGLRTLKKSNSDQPLIAIDSTSGSTLHSLAAAIVAEDRNCLLFYNCSRMDKSPDTKDLLVLDV